MSESMNLNEEYVFSLFANYLETQMSLADYLPTQIAQAAQKMVECLLQDGKILICGNGASSANALHFSTALTHQYTVERPALPVIVLSHDCTVLSTSANIGEYAHVFSRQIQALGNDKDLLLILTTNCDSNSLMHAVDAAKERQMNVVVLNGQQSSALSRHLGSEDVEIRVKLAHPARVRETHLFILHCFCDLIDKALFGS
jgi:D-sedoheptulose 7-phosphate isomerase